MRSLRLMSPINEDVEKLINPLVTIIPLNYLDVLLVLNRKLEDKDIEWALSGNLGETLKTVHVEPDCIEITTTKEGARQIFQAVLEYDPRKIRHRTEELPRPALIAGKEYSVKIRSHYFEFGINSVTVKVFGDLQFKIGNWAWGDRLEFEPEYVYVVGQKMPVTPLPLKYHLYHGLGWADRARKIRDVLIRIHRIKSG
jgi:hypothetical protein